jgi:hypothetical protein
MRNFDWLSFTSSGCLLRSFKDALSTVNIDRHDSSGNGTDRPERSILLQTAAQTTKLGRPQQLRYRAPHLQNRGNLVMFIALADSRNPFPILWTLSSARQLTHEARSPIPF